jgi:hypothetical protein
LGLAGAQEEGANWGWVLELDANTSVEAQFRLWSAHSLLFLLVKQVLEEEHLEAGEDPLPVLQEFFQAHRSSILADERTASGVSGVASNIPTSTADLPSYALRFMRAHSHCEPFSPASTRSPSPVGHGGSSAQPARGLRGRQPEPCPSARRVQPSRQGRGKTLNYWESTTSRSRSPRGGSR